MKLLPIEPACPQCGARKIVYTCEPKCCFNHICPQCKFTFLLHTATAGEQVAALQGDRPEIDSCMPTTACAECDSLKVFQLAGDGRVVCADCGMLLTLEYHQED